MTATSPSVLQNLMKQAIVAHLQGQLGSAEALYRSVLDEDQSNPVLYANLGTLCLSTGRYQEAIELLQQALTLKPDYALAYNSLGIAWQQQKDWDQSLKCYRQALTLQENYPDAWNNLGNLFHQWERFPDAIKAFKQALQYKQDYAEAWFNLGNSLQALNRPADAIAAYRAVLKLKPQSHLALNNLGILLQQRGNLIQAEQCYRQSLEFCPDFLEAQSNLALILAQSQQPEAALEVYQKLIAALENREHEFRGTPIYLNTLKQLGVLLEESGQYDAAIDRYRQVVAQQPHSEGYYHLGNALQKKGDLAAALEAYHQSLSEGSGFVEGWNNLGNTFKKQGDLPAAIEAYQKALALNPQDATTWNNLGTVYHRQGQLTAASDCYHRATVLNPDHGDAQFNLSLILLSTGQLHSGWWVYEYRFCKQTPIPLDPPLGVDRWNESFEHEGTLVLVTEQGLGDTLQFIRYGAVLKERGIQSLAIVVPPPLLEILSTCAGYDRVLPAGSELPQDLPQPYCWFPLLSVPRVCRTHLDSIPAPSPYLYASPHRVEEWQQRLQSLPGLKIGLCWQGNEKTEQENLQGRSCPLAAFEPLTQLPQVSLISLQKGLGEQALQEVSFGDRIHQFGEALDCGDQAFVDTAAIVSQLDLVITTDTSIAHLAGALGQQTWVLLHHGADWRWLQERSDSPWYPTVRLFRQCEPGNWQPVMAAVIEALTTTNLRPLPHVSVSSPRILVSVGELLDKISILSIKVQRVKQPQYHQQVTEELAALNQELDRLALPETDVQANLVDLQKVNQSLWKLKNQIRLVMKVKEHSENQREQLIKIAESICHYSDRRALLKQKINETYNSQVKDIKVYSTHLRP